MAFFLPDLAGSARLVGFTATIFGLFNLRRLVWDVLTDLEVVGGLGAAGLHTFGDLPGDSATVCQATASATQTAAAAAPSAVQAL